MGWNQMHSLKADRVPRTSPFIINTTSLTPTLMTLAITLTRPITQGTPEKPGTQARWPIALRL